MQTSEKIKPGTQETGEAKTNKNYGIQRREQNGRPTNGRKTIGITRAC